MSETDFVMSQAYQAMGSYFKGQSRLELIGTITALFWIIAGIFNDPFLLIFAGGITIGLFLYFSVISLLPKIEYFYPIHSAAFRRMLVAGLAHWQYSGPDNLEFFDTNIPVYDLSEITFLSLLIFWFATRYLDQIKNDELEKRYIPFLLVRGVLRGGMIAGAIYALVSDNLIPDNYQFPWLFSFYLIEPFWYAFYQTFNKTYSTRELTLGSARLPSVALRESFISNFFLILITMLFDGLTGEEWQLLRVAYLMGAIIIFVYSMDSIKKFNENPLGNEILGNFLKNTPDSLRNIDLEQEYGHVLNKNYNIKLSKDSELDISEGSILVPLEKQKDKVTALVIGKGKNIVKNDGQKIAETIDGVTSVIISQNELKPIFENTTAERLKNIDFSKYQLPSIMDIQKNLNLLSSKMEGWVRNITKELTKYDLSNYSITTTEDTNTVNLPGVFVHEAPGLTQVRTMGVRVYEQETDRGDATIVRWSNMLTVVDFPGYSFVSLPGITVLDLGSGQSAVNILGMKISDGIPADKLEEFKSALLSQINKFELGLDTELGRILADKNAIGLMSMSFDGEFKPMLESNKRKIGDHAALQLSSGKKSNYYLPGNLEETKGNNDQSKSRFIELTGSEDKSSSKSKYSDKITKTKDKVSKKMSKHDNVDEKIKSIKEEINANDTISEDKYPNIIDAEIIEEDDEEENG